MVNPYGINTLLVNALCTFFINSKPTFISGSRVLARNLVRAIKLFTRPFRKFLACLLVRSKLGLKLGSSLKLPIAFVVVL